MAPSYTLNNPFDLAYLQGVFDEELKNGCTAYDEHTDLGLSAPSASVGISQFFATESQSSRGTLRGVCVPRIRDVADRAQGTLKRPIDLTDDGDGQFDPNQALKAVPFRHIDFSEDVRPAYFGTYTKIRSPRTIRKIRRNPFTRGRQDTNYDYDSEAEWEEPEEGEECLDDEEDEADSNGDADDMDAFLDDEDDIKQKRRAITGDLQSTSTGLCWEDQNGKIVLESTIDVKGATPAPPAMRGMRLGFLLPGFTGQTIDPFSTSYWDNGMAPPSIPIADLLAPSGAPLRPPLQERVNSSGKAAEHGLVGAGEGQKGPITSLAATQGGKCGPKPRPKTLSKEDMEEFKEAVVGSDVGKLELCKALKDRFPKITNETIKETLGSCFAQVGTTKAAKKWVYVGAS